VDGAVHGGSATAGGIAAFETERPGEVVYWLPRHRALAAVAA
jgi:hypothetical protein